jgi:hypothetical protein
VIAPASRTAVRPKTVRVDMGPSFGLISCSADRG